MKKYLDILLFSLLFFMIFSYFSGNNQKQQASGIFFSSVQENYKVPANVQLQVSNLTQSGVLFNSCTHLSLRANGTLLSFPPEFCADYTLLPTQILVLDFSKYYTLFETPGNYTFEFEVADQKFVQAVEVEYRGTLGKIFVGMFFAPLYNLFAYLIHFFGNSLGWAIIAITVIIRILLLFPQHKMMVSQRKMQAIQPKIKALQEKHKGNQQQIGLELMKLYKDEGVNPMGSCGFLLIQMPILLVIYNIIANITSLSNEFYLYDFLPEFHISQIQSNFYGVSLLEAGGLTGILLALGVGVVQYLQVKLSLHQKAHSDAQAGIVLEKKKDATDYNSFMPDPEMMNKFLLYGMPVMVAIFTYTIIAGVGVYWGISTIFAILQQIFVNKIIKK